MNAVMRDKCAARRIARAGCVDALGIVRARNMDTTLPKTNAERVSAWRARSHKPGFGGTYVRPWQTKNRDWSVTVPESRPPIVDCPQGDTPWMPLVTVPQPLRESPRAAPPGQGGASPSRHAADDGESRDYLNTQPGAPGKDWFNGPECAAILAQPVEPCTENPFAGDCEPDLEIDA